MPVLHLLLLALLAVQAAHAGPLAEALEQAWARHPQAGGQAARESAARAGVDLAAALTPAPASLSLATLDDRLTGNSRGRREWELELAMPLWLPGQKAARGAEAEAALAELAAQRQALRLRLAGELRRNWWAVASARAGVEQARLRAEGMRALAEDVGRRHRAGELARVDANLARGELTRAEAEVLAAEAALAGAEQAWRALTGAPAPRELPAETHPGPAPAAAADAHPELVLRAAVRNAAQARLRLARESRRDAPELAFRLLRERDDAHARVEHSAGVKLAIPFASEARSRRDDAAARAELAEAEAELARARAGVELEVERARRALELAEGQYALAVQRAPLLAENLRLAEKAFALGEGDLAALLRVRALAVADAAETARLRLARDAAVSELLQAMGVLP